MGNKKRGNPYAGTPHADEHFPNIGKALPETPLTFTEVIARVNTKDVKVKNVEFVSDL